MEEDSEQAPNLTGAGAIHTKREAIRPRGLADIMIATILEL